MKTETETPTREEKRMNEKDERDVLPTAPTLDQIRDAFGEGSEVSRINAERREELLRRIGDYPRRATTGTVVRVPLHKLTGGSR